MYSGDVPRTTGLNSFGQPFRGKRIRGVGREEHAVGMAYSAARRNQTGPLSARGPDSQGAFAQRKMDEAAAAQRQAMETRAQEAVEKGRAAAQAANPSAAPMGKFAAAASRSANAAQAMNPPAPAKRQGQMIETGPGRSRWMSGEEMDAMEAQKKKARLSARRTVNYSKPRATARFDPVFAR
jgi:hypothetical protein